MTRDDLVAERDGMVKAYDQTVVRMHRLAGAVQALDYLIAVMDERDEQATDAKAEESDE